MKIQNTKTSDAIGDAPSKTNHLTIFFSCDDKQVFHVCRSNVQDEYSARDILPQDNLLQNGILRFLVMFCTYVNACFFCQSVLQFFYRS